MQHNEEDGSVGFMHLLMYRRMETIMQNQVIAVVLQLCNNCDRPSCKPSSIYLFMLEQYIQCLPKYNKAAAAHCGYTVVVTMCELHLL